MNPEQLGLQLASDLRHNGEKLLEAAAIALEDANYHSEARTVLGLMGVTLH